MSRSTLDTPSIYVEAHSREEKYDDTIKIKIKENPSDNNSDTCEKKYVVFTGEGDHVPEEYCEFRLALDNLIKQKPIADYTGRFTYVELLLGGQASVDWSAAWTTVSTTGNNGNQQGERNWKRTLHEFATRYFNTECVEKQKSYMRNVRKPFSLTVQQFANRIIRLNNFIPFFPSYQFDGNDVPREPQKLDLNELYRLIKQAMPDRWQKEHNKIHDSQTSLTDLIKFFTTLEENDNTNGRNATKKQSHKQQKKKFYKRGHDDGSYSSGSSRRNRKKSKRKKKKRSRSDSQSRTSKSSGSSKKGKYCFYCRKDGHDIEECRSVKRHHELQDKNKKRQAKRNKEINQARLDDSGSSSDSSSSKSNNSSSSYSQSSSQTLDNTDEYRGNPNFMYVDTIADTINTFGQPARKRRKVSRYKTMTEGHVIGNIRKKKKKLRLKILFDSGASASIIKKSCLLHGMKTIKEKKRQWLTKGGIFTTTSIAEVNFTLSLFDPSKEITWNFHVDETDSDSNYDMIIGEDILNELGITLDYNTKSMAWEDKIIDMTRVINEDEFERLLQYGEAPFESEAVKQTSLRQTRILDANYKKADLKKVVNNIKGLNGSEKRRLSKLLKDYEYLFDGTLGDFQTDPVSFELKPDAKPVNCKPFPVPKIHEETFKKEIDRLISIGVLKKAKASKWTSPTFIVPKKNGTVRFVSDFRKLNKQIHRKPYPIPKISDTLQRLEGFTYASALDLNMGYYTIRLDPAAQEMCTIITPFGRYAYQRLPMGVCVSADIFQEEMMNIMAGLDFVRTYIDDLLLISKGNADDHIDKLELVFQRLAEAGLKVNMDKSELFQTEIEYLGFQLTREGIFPIAKKVEAIHQLAPPTTRKQLRSFIGMVNYYRDMWQKRSHILDPLTELTSKKKRFVWEKVHQEAFDKIKSIISKETMLNYPDFNLPFEIHTDASDRQLGAVIMQNGKPIAFFSRKLRPEQRRYTVTEKELLSIVETLKEYKGILLGHEIRVSTDHQNLTYDNLNSDRVHRWRLFLEEFHLELKYIKGKANWVADALSRLEIKEELGMIHTPFEEMYVDEDISEDIPFPLNMQRIYDEQQKQKDLIPTNKKAKNFQLKQLYNKGSLKLWHYKERIVIPTVLQQHIIDWYHTVLLHPGTTRTYQAISDKFYWPKMENQIRTTVKKCSICQRQKKQKKKFGKIPAKDADETPWSTVCIDLIGPYTVKTTEGDRELLAMTMIDPASSWFEIAEIDNKDAETVALTFDREWLCRYPRPERVISDRGSEFIAAEFSELLTSYGIKRKLITAKNPQANSIVERVHQVIGNMLRSFDLEEQTLDPKDPWKGYLSSVAFAIRATPHTTLGASPSQLVFGRDMILPIQYRANWERIRQQKQNIINKNNKRENSTRIEHKYKVGDKVLITNMSNRKLHAPSQGPFPILEVNTNGTVKIQRGKIRETINIRRLLPFYS